jgi:hypothetical protein
MKRLSREYLTQGKAATFQALRAFLDPINTKGRPSYEEVAAQLEVSVGALKTLIHRLRKQYTAFVREDRNVSVCWEAVLEGKVFSQGFFRSLLRRADSFFAGACRRSLFESVSFLSIMKRARTQGVPFARRAKALRESAFAPSQSPLASPQHRDCGRRPNR